MSRPVIGAFVECSVMNNPSVGFRISEQNVIFESPLLEEEEGAVFKFDSLHHYSAKDLEGKSPVVNVLKDYDRIGTSTTGSAPRPLFLFHGPFLACTATIFIHAIECILCELAHNHPQLGADMRLLRVYSWDTTDVIGRRIVEQRGYTPLRYSRTVDDSIGCVQRHQIAFQHLEQELPRVRGLLRDALIVPEGHCVFICVISISEDCVEGVPTFCLYLIPPLRRVKSLLKKDLLALRSAWCEMQSPPSAAPTHFRLAHSSTEIIPPKDIHVFAVLATTSAQSTIQDFYLQCCYGCRMPFNVMEKYGSSLMVPSCSTFELQPQTLSVKNNCLAPDRQTGMDTAANRLGLSVPNSSETYTGSPKQPTWIADSLPSAGRIHGTSKSHPWDAQNMLTMGEGSDRPSINELQCCKEKLGEEIAALRDDVQHLEQYKVELENAFGVIFGSLKELTEDLATEESAMLTEIERAASILGFAEASSRAQEQQMLTRLTALLNNTRIPFESLNSS